MYHKLVGYTPASSRSLLAHTEKACEAGIVVDAKTNAVFNQRPRSETAVKKYVESILANKWHAETGETIKLAKWNGGNIILDGQHRLAAVDASGKNVQIWTAFDVPLSAFPFLDQGVSRSAADILSALGWDDPQMFATIARLMYREKKGDDPRTTNDKSRAVEAVIAEFIGPKQEALYAMRDEFNTDARKAVRAGVGAHRPGLMFSLMQAAQIDPEMAKLVSAYLADTRECSPPHAVWADFAEVMGNPKHGLVAEAKEAASLGHHATSNATLCNIIVTAFPVAWNIARSGAKRWGSRKGLEKRVRNALPPGAFEAME